MVANALLILTCLTMLLLALDKFEKLPFLGEKNISRTLAE